jgi:hypothetical protein
MVLNFTFANWSSLCTRGGKAQRLACIRKIAIHEFGHALGFAHEQNRGDAPQFCKGERQGTDGDYPITVYDPSSIMNYCNPKWNNDGFLSKLDRSTARYLYGEPQ